MVFVLEHHKCAVVEQFTRGKMVMTAADTSITILEFRDAKIFHIHWWTSKELFILKLAN